MRTLRAASSILIVMVPRVDLDTCRLGAIGNGFRRSARPTPTRGSWQWSYAASEPHAKISDEANLIDAEAAWLKLTYSASGIPMHYRVRLVTTEPTYGGRRWWFMLPAGIHGRWPASARREALSAAGGRYLEAARPTSSPTRHAKTAGNLTGSIGGWPRTWARTRHLSGIRLALKRL